MDIIPCEAKIFHRAIQFVRVFSIGTVGMVLFIAGSSYKALLNLDKRLISLESKIDIIIDNSLLDKD